MKRTAIILGIAIVLGTGSGVVGVSPAFAKPETPTPPPVQTTNIMKTKHASAINVLGNLR